MSYSFHPTLTGVLLASVLLVLNNLAIDAGLNILLAFDVSMSWAVMALTYIITSVGLFTLGFSWLHWVLSNEFVEVN